MKVTIDTNVLISGTFWTGDSFRILESVDKKEVKSVSSKKIIEEYYEVINSDEIIGKIEKKKLITHKITEKIIKNSELVEPRLEIDAVKDDPDDNKIIECAKEGKVDYIISQDEHLLGLKKFENIKILNPKDFLKLLKRK